MPKKIRVWQTIGLVFITVVLYLNHRQLPEGIIIQLIVYFTLSFSIVALVHLFDQPSPSFIYEQGLAQTFSAPISVLQPQQAYLDKVYGENKTALSELTRQIPEMSKHCLLAINLPAYREGSHVYQALTEYTIKQRTVTEQSISPDLFEINLLLNRPRPDIPFDQETEQEILRFKQDFPQYHIYLLRKTFQFEQRPLMGLIYKRLADLAIYRNLQRSDSLQRERLILRTGGADAKEKNPYFLAHLFEVFKNPKVAIYRSESRYPKAVLQKCPLLHVLAVLESGLNRVYTRGYSNVGLGTYRAEIYAQAGGFNPRLPVAEEIDLATRMAKTVAQYPEKYLLRKDLWKNAIDNPRRAIWALYTNRGMANKYDHFGEEAIEAEIHAQDWQNKLLLEALPPHMLLTPANLTREVTLYYRQYLTRVRLYSQTIQQFKRRATREAVRQRTYQITHSLFQRIFRHLGIPKDSYTFIQRELNQPNSQAHIIFKDFSHLEKLINQRTFNGHQVFYTENIQP